MVCFIARVVHILLKPGGPWFGTYHCFIAGPPRALVCLLASLVRKRTTESHNVPFSFTLLRAYFLHNDEQLSTSEACFESQRFTSVFHHVQQQFHAGKTFINLMVAWLIFGNMNKYLRMLRVTCNGPTYLAVAVIKYFSYGVKQFCFMLSLFKRSYRHILKWPRKNLLLLSGTT